MNTKECTGCHRVKPWSEYHMRPAAGGKQRPQTRCRNCANAARAERDARKRRGEHVPLEFVPTEPLANWLRHVLKRDGITQSELALRLNVDERQIRRVVTRESRSITVDLADRILCHEGTAMLIDIYPSLYESAA